MATGAERGEGAIGRLALRRAIRGACIWGTIAGLFLFITGVGYTSAYGTDADRIAIAAEIGGNPAFEALYGPGRELQTIGGFVSWRVGNFIALIAAVWGFLLATRLLRGEEDEGRWDTLLSGPVSRVGATAATLAAIGVAAAALFAVAALGVLLLAAVEDGFAAGPGLYLALAATITAAPFAAVGALASQLAPSRREAAGLAAVVFAIALTARVAADASESVEWLRWATPFGWAIEMRAFAGPQPAWILPLVAWTAVLCGAALLLARARDVGGAVVSLRSDRRSHTALLGSPIASALRAALGGIAGWAAGLAFFGFVFGLLAADVAEAARDIPRLQETLREIGIDIDFASAEGFVATIFLFMAIAVALYAVTHVTAWRDEESHGRLDLVLAQPHGRRVWLGGRVAVAAVATAALALLAGLAAWAGMAARGTGVAVGPMLETGLNLVPLALLFLGLGILMFGIVPRHAGALLYGAVAASYAWELTGSIIDAPEWSLTITPFHHLALVPAEPLDGAASGGMLAVGLVAAAIGIEAFRRRDLIGD